MKWLRLYSSVLHDPKVQRLPPALFKHWINLLCLASESEARGLLPCVEDIAFALRVRPSAAHAIMAQLARAGLIDQTQDGRASVGRFMRKPRDDGRLALSEWRELRTRVFARDDYTCQYCGVRGVRPQCDHVIPVSRGGSNDLSNLVTACKPCNQSKHKKTPEEWLAGGIA